MVAMIATSAVTVAARGEGKQVPLIPQTSTTSGQPTTIDRRALIAARKSPRPEEEGAPRQDTSSSGRLSQLAMAANSDNDDDGSSKLAQSPSLSERQMQASMLPVKSDQFQIRSVRKQETSISAKATLVSGLLLVLGALLLSPLDSHSGDNGNKQWSLSAQLQTLAILHLLPVEAQTSLLSSLYLSSAQGSQAPSILKRDLGVLGARKPPQWPQAQSAPTQQKQQLRPNEACQVSNGESVAIVELEESRGTDMSQSTSPAELPISGSVEAGEIELKIESETHKYFQIQEKRLKLTRPLDRDAILKEISCLDRRQQPPAGKGSQEQTTSSGKQAGARKVIIPVLVKVLDLNDNAPKFSQPVYTVQVNELTPVGSVVFDQIQAIDLDSANNGLIEYTLVGAKSTQSLADQAPSSVGGAGGASQRLVQRAQQTTTSSRPTDTITTTTPAAMTTTGRPSSASLQSQQELSGADSSSVMVAPTSSSASSEQPATSSASSAESGERAGGDRGGAVGGPPPPRSAPTINLSSEPILNGPMEEGEAEEESDEALLASMNSANDTELESSDSDSADLMMVPTTTTASGHNLAGAPGRRRRRRRSGGHPARAPLSTSPKNPDKDVADANQQQQQGEHWTNLMMMAGEEEPWTAASAQPAAQDYRARPSDSDAADFFSLELSSSNKPVIKLRRPLDYESRRVHLLKVVATDRAAGSRDRLSSVATIAVRVLDGDDQGPAFLLDQTGCATGPIPSTTASLASAIPSSPPFIAAGGQVARQNNGRRFLKRRANQQDQQQQAQSQQAGVVSGGGGDHFPRGFKVTDENFEFSDMSIGDELLDNDDGTSDADSGNTGDDVADDQLIRPLIPPTDQAPVSSGSSSSSAAGLRSRRYQAAGANSASTTRTALAAERAFNNFATSSVNLLVRQRQQSTLSTAGRAQVSSSDSPLRQQQQNYHYRTDYGCLLPAVLTGSDNQQQVAEYFATVMTGDSDYLVRVAPQAIKARDRDELNAQIRYSFVNGTPTNFSQYFQINQHDASIKQVAPIGRRLGKFVIWVQAQEQTVNKLASFAKLTIQVIETDRNPPVLVPNSHAGFVAENSPIGSRVMIIGSNNSSDGSMMATTAAPNAVPMRISILDADWPASPPSFAATTTATTAMSAAAASIRNVHLYEFSTTSDAFKVDKDGFVYVNKWPLDRDPPSQAVHMFQVTARQIGLTSSLSISSPVSISVSLLDLNDNAPVISNQSLSPVQIAATPNGRSARLVTTIRAIDIDSQENARSSFSIKHVSNNGKGRFRIDEHSGELEALGKFTQGEQFSLTLQVSDDLARSSQAILEVSVAPGPNTGGPQFVLVSSPPPPPTSSADGPATGGGNPMAASEQVGAGASDGLSRGYSAKINEGVAPSSVVLQVQAIDPENDPITYSIVDGNINNDFTINARTGHIYVNNKLDREEVSAYTLLIQARDSGGLAANKPVYISISDNNDENPIFAQSQYVFSVEEGVAGGKQIGRVSAQDNDSGENGKISYLLSAAPGTNVNTIASNPGANSVDQRKQRQRPLFSVDEQTGVIRVLEPLDYETSRSHTLIVAAKDHGENPRSTTASVLINVIDVQDELPYFERYFLESKVPESSASSRVGQVQARDPDSVANVTYVLKSGDSSLFSVDPQSGLVSTKRRLDFEQAQTHTLLVGTIENQEIDLLETANLLSEALSSGLSFERSPICRIDVTVLDVNDNAPQFASQPLPVRVQDSAQLGTIVTRLTAEDLDGSEPNNQIRYELLVASSSTNNSQSSRNEASAITEITSEKCAQFFMVDATSGDISVKSDLRQDTQSECVLIIRAHDLATGAAGGQQQQQLSSTTSQTVFIEHIAEISSSSMIGFADTSFTVELEENSPPNTLVKVLPVVNKPKVYFPMSCAIVSGNELSKFYVSENEQRDCELKTRDLVLDYEQRSRFSLTLRLNTIGSGSSKTLAQVNVNLLDKNDNRPVFYQPARYSHLTQNRFLAAIANDAPSETQVLQLRASDADSAHANGLVSYEILNDGELEGRFKVGLLDGIVRTGKPVEDLPNARLPIKLKVMARDNPDLPSESLDSTAEVLVNLIEDRHRIILVLKDTPTGRALDSKEELLGAIQERTGLISGLEKAESLKIQRNGSALESDVSGTDLWFYLIEPGTFRIVPSDDARIRAALFEHRSQKSLLDVVSQSLGFNAVRVRLPYSTHAQLNGARNGEIPSSLMLAGLFIAIICALVVIYQCGFWSSYHSRMTTSSKKKEKLYTNPNFHPSQYYNSACPAVAAAAAAASFGAYPAAPLGQTKPQSLQALQSPHDGSQFNFRPAFSTLPHPHHFRASSNSTTGKLAAEHFHQQAPTPNNATLANSINANTNKEYETQMLKMSVLFDDCQSFDEQNLNENNISSKNLS